MSMFDEELTLPGVMTNVVAEYNSGYDTTQFGTTDSVTILGTAFNGVVGKPVKIYSPDHAKYVFGPEYDYKTRREATLVAEIKNAWDRGCRTIYAVRVTGKEIYKDYQLATSSKIKLRVSGLCPHNGNKDVYFEYDAVDTFVEKAVGTEASIKLYKPASRATIAEKKNGRVNKENSILVNTVKLKSSWNITEETRLVDFIKNFNEYAYNNVMKITLVDENGLDVTETAEAQGLAFGDLFPGVYFIGRDRNAANLIATTEMDVKFVEEDEQDSIYEGVNGHTVKVLNCNTDITKDLPIYHKDALALNKLIDKVDGVTMYSLFDFLTMPGKVDLLWLKDKVDYEEVHVSDFDMYKRLGCGFATTAKIVETKKGSGIYKVVETIEELDPNKVVELKNGVYSMLENLKSDYRVVTNKYADQDIKGKLPKKQEFLIANPKRNSIFSETIDVIPKLDKKDLIATPKTYTFELTALADNSELLSKDEVLAMTEKQKEGYNVNLFALVAEDISKVDTAHFINGDLVLVGAKMHRFDGKKFVELSSVESYEKGFTNKYVFAGGKLYEVDSTKKDALTFKEVTAPSDTLKDKKYILVQYRKETLLFEVTVAEQKISKVAPIARLEDVLSESFDMFVTIVPEITTNKVAYKVSISAMNLETTTLNEFIIALNENIALNKTLEFEMCNKVKETTAYASILKASNGQNTYIFDKKNASSVVDTATPTGHVGTDHVSIEDRKAPRYDRSLYIPFRTNDNFARQLAQHCMYTSLKTAPTHGVIGCSKLMSTDLVATDARVKQLVAREYDLYAKKPNGNNMLDKDNMPYAIGKAISVTFFQNAVNTGSNYTYISSGASAYAGMVSRLPIDQSSTSQNINLNNIMFELTNYHLEMLTKAGYITVKDSYSNGFVVTDGVTMAPVISPFRRLAVTRIINNVDEAIRQKAEPFIGKPNHIANRNSLQTAIKSTLDKMLDKLIQKFDFNIVQDTSLEEMGIIKINYSIIPVYEIRAISNEIRVTGR